eukprot:844-Heterococcus_DN1.PRE.2
MLVVVLYSMPVANVVTWLVLMSAGSDTTQAQVATAPVLAAICVYYDVRYKLLPVLSCAHLAAWDASCMSAALHLLQQHKKHDSYSLLMFDVHHVLNH